MTKAAPHCDRDQLTQALQSAVPLAQALGLTIDQISPDQTVCSVAAREMALNQNGTLQASTFYILADYTAGVAAFSALPEFSLFGLQREQGKPALQGWLKDGFVQHIRPATGDIRAVCAIEPEARVRMNEELKTKGKTSYRGEMAIFQADQLVAKASHTVVFKRI